jgi:hypothetical protein
MVPALETMMITSLNKWSTIATHDGIGVIKLAVRMLTMILKAVLVTLKSTVDSMTTLVFMSLAREENNRSLKVQAQESTKSM